MFEKFTRFFLDNHKITLVVITTVSFFGILSYLMLPKQYNPSIVAPAFEIRIPVPGYGSEQASQFVVRELENRLRELPGIDKLYGYSEDEYAAVTVSFQVGTDLEAAKTRLHDKITSNMGSKPYGVQDISIRSIDPEELPQVAFALTYTGTGLSEIDTGIYLRTVANQIKESMKTVKGTSNLEILGGYDNGIHIQPDVRALEIHRLSVSDLGNILKSTIGERIMGISESGGKRNVISVDGEGNSVESLKNLPILDVGGVKLLLKDVAEVRR
jgi:multidrug efflux pump subunit AcrB